MIGSMTGKSRPDFKAGALLSTVHRSFGMSAFLVAESSLMELGTSERRNLRSRFMQRSSKGLAPISFVFPPFLPFRAHLTKGKIKHCKGSVILVNDERSATLSDKAERPEKKRQSAPGFCSETSCNQILARFLLVKSATKGINVLYNPIFRVPEYSELSVAI